MKDEPANDAAEPERDSLIDRHGFDAVMKAFLSVPRKAEEGEKVEEAGEDKRRKRREKASRKR